MFFDMPILYFMALSYIYVRERERGAAGRTSSNLTAHRKYLELCHVYNSATSLQEQSAIIPFCFCFFFRAKNIIH